MTNSNLLEILAGLIADRPRYVENVEQAEALMLEAARTVKTAKENLATLDRALATVERIQRRDIRRQRRATR